MNQKSAVPVRKVGSSAIAGALVTILIWADQQYLHQQISPDVAAAIVALVMFSVGYMVPASSG